MTSAVTRCYAGTYDYPVLWGDGSLYTGNGKGISQLAFDEAQGTFRLEAVYEGILNPSYIAVNRRRNRLYCVNELDCFEGKPGGSISAYAVGALGRLERIGQVASQGESPCHLCFSPDEGFLCVANYNGGSLCVLPLSDQGAFAPPFSLLRHSGHGPNPLRQEKPHVHSTLFSPDGRWAIVADLGCDRLAAYAANPEGLSHSPIALSTPPGSGPRMVKAHPGRRAYYCLCELSNVLLVYEMEPDGRPGRMLQQISTLPGGIDPGSAAADIAISNDGAMLYASNRGSDTIAAFSIDAKGLLTPRDAVPCGGKTPRSLTLSPSGRWLIACNQDGDCLGIFNVEGGCPYFTGVFELPTPTCLAFA